MGERACADPVAAWREPGAVAGRHRKRTGQFRAADALHRRAGGEFLEGTPGRLTIWPITNRMDMLAAGAETAPAGRSECRRTRPSNRMPSGFARTDLP